MGVNRITLNDMDLSTGKKTRLYRMLYDYGTKNGTLIFLPIDHGLEHGPMDFHGNPESGDADFQFRLAVEGGYSGIAVHIGLAEKYHKKYAGRVPLVLKINGRTNIPSDDAAFSPLTSSVEDAVRLGADAIGYTLYVGSPSQDRDIKQFNDVRKECDKFGMPIIMWAYPRGFEIEAKGGRDSLYAVDYAARIANELGADVVKLNMPKFSDADVKSPKPYNALKLDTLESLKKVVKSAGKTMVLFSGGGKIQDQDLAGRAKVCMEGGATGLIFGRNMWQREFQNASKMTNEIKKMMGEYGN